MESNTWRECAYLVIKEIVDAFPKEDSNRLLLLALKEEMRNSLGYSFINGGPRL